MLTTRTGAIGAVFSLLLASPGWCGEDRPIRLEHPKAVFGVVFAPDGRTLYTAGDDQVLRAWDVRTGRVRRRLQQQTGGVLAVVLTAKGKTLASVGHGGTVRLLEARTGRLMEPLIWPRGDVKALALSAEGSRLVAAQGGGFGALRPAFETKLFL